jgi:peptidyl-prolyl cis-trans isomerase SurA
VTPTRLPRLRSSVRPWAGAALAAVLLSGCSAVPALEPGIAGRVGDDTITVSRVDQVAEHYCEAAEQQLSDDQVIAGHFLRGQTAGALALRAAAEQFAAAQGVTADPSYDQAVENARQSLTSLTEDQQDAFIAVQGAGAYVGAVELAAGRKIVGQSGTGKAADDAAQAAGAKAFQKWLDDHDIELDPRFGISIASGKTEPIDTSLSYAVSDAATNGAADSADASYAAGLPDAQRCN